MRGYVYKIESDCKSICYIGSTIQKLKQRFNEHKSKSKSKSKNSKCAIYKYLVDSNYMFSNGCELIEEYEIVDRNHLLAYEQLYINKYRCINEQSAFQLSKKLQSKFYYESNKDKIAIWHKEYRAKNKNKITVQRKEYESKNKDKIKTRRNGYLKKNKDKIAVQRKEYKSKNKDKIDAQNKEYRKKNKEIINSKITCECGFISSKSNLARHLKTKKHTLFLTSIKTY